MSRILLLFLCFGIAVSFAACASLVESDSLVSVKSGEDSYQYTDEKLSYVITNNLDSDTDCFASASLEKKTTDQWNAVPSTIPNPVAWCGTQSSLNSGKSVHTIPFSDYNGTLSEGIYRVAVQYSSDYGSNSGTVYSNEFALTGDFPMSYEYSIPANVYLSFESDTFSGSSDEINYIIMNESGGDIFISPKITLMLYQNSEWKSFIYQAGADEIASSQKINARTISTDKLPDGFENCTKLRIIEQLAIPIQNEFYIGREIQFD